MGPSERTQSHQFEYSMVFVTPEAADGNHREIEIRTTVDRTPVEASYSYNEFLSLLNQIDKETPIQHLSNFSVTGNAEPVNGSQLTYNSNYGIYEITQSGADYSIPFTPEDIETLLRMVDGVKAEYCYDGPSYVESLPLAIYLRASRKNHIIRGGSPACGYDVAVSHPKADSVVPTTDLPKDRLAHAVHTESLCTQCSRIAREAGLTEDLSPEDAAGPTCPVTGQEATGISISHLTGTYLELPNGRQEITKESLNEWRYGQRDDVEAAD